MFREVRLPEGIPGRLFLHSMPGRYEPLDVVWDQLKMQGISVICCLATSNEVQAKSPEFDKALKHNSVPCQVIAFGIPDFGVPDDRKSYWKLAGEVATLLRNSQHVLIHCGAGIGRTGMLAECTLLSLGHAPETAHGIVSDADSGAETAEQKALIAWCAAQK